ncbi:hypothetical protein [Streptomyces luteogriseus]|uniref:hypothetical protein n=1 Tax=Streptomyces luteogriseus TaxID=68233 RepID=UPI003790903E
MPAAADAAIHRLRDHADVLVDGFHLPEEVLAARPIASAAHHDHFDHPAARWNATRSPADQPRVCDA